MTVAVVYELALADGLAPVSGAAPWDVLARQVPRLLVARLNGASDRGVRFFPFLGNDGGKRCFLVVRDLLPPETLAQMHRQGDVQCIIDGRIQDDGLRLRILDGPTLRTRFDADLPFDPRAPLDVLQRAEFEAMTALGWEGPPGPAPALQGAALSWFLVAKDALLALEAGLPRDDSFDPVRAAQRCAELEPDDPDVQAVVLEIAAHLVRGRPGSADALELVAQLAERGPDAPRFLEQAAELLVAGGAEQRGTAIAVRSAQRWPDQATLAHQAAALLFRQGRLLDACEVLRSAVAAGNRAVSVLAQLAGIEDLLGHHAERDQLCAQILEQGDPPPTVARLLLAFLLEQGRAAEALALADRALLAAAEDPALWLERGRALLLLDQPAAAVPALQRALSLDCPSALRTDVERLLRVARIPGLLPALQRVERAVKSGHLADAVRMLRSLVAQHDDSAESWLLLGVVRQKLRQLRRAEKALRRALSLQPDLGEAHNRLGILLVARGRVAKGYGHLLQALALAPGDPSVRVHLAQACALMGRKPEGEQHLAEAARLGASAATVAAVRKGFFGA